MATIIDPTGTPTFVFNRSGTTIQTLSCLDDTNPPTVIPRYCGVTIVMADCSISNTLNAAGFKLDTTFEVGDLLEIYYIGAYTHPIPVFNTDGVTNITDTGNVRTGQIVRLTSAGWFVA